MNKKIKAPGCVGAQTEAEVEIGEELFSTNNYITDPNRTQGMIEKLLPVGEENAIKSGELMLLAGFSNTRQLRDAIAEERASGALIISTCRPPFGYFLPSDGEQGRQEILRFIRTVHRRAIGTQIALRSARRALRECYGQEALQEAVTDGEA